MNINEKLAILRREGIFVGDRNPNRNKAFTGAFMVAENNDPDIITDDAGTHGFCIVGDDLHALIAEAFDQLDY